ncbi:MAG: dihydrofolate reductase [Candidatus Aenigmarchaeota archaeon]|nr:dihydrofolate reductase [Candidatus Aenigmarchaeota archaeon]
MTQIIVIAAVARNNVIGKDGDIPWHIPEDLKHFRDETSGFPVIMGRKTYESLPKKPLKGRLNIVLTRRKDYKPGKGVVVKNSLKEAIEYCEKKNYVRAFIGGGASIYKQALSFADKLDITRVHKDYEGDTYFPEIDPDKWQLVEKDDQNGYSFLVYVRR